VQGGEYRSQFNAEWNQGGELGKGDKKEKEKQGGGAAAR